MRSADYWRRRFEALEAMTTASSDQAIRDMERIFSNAQRDLQNQISGFYDRFATNNQIDLAEAKRLLNTRELAEFRWTVDEYIDFAKRNTVSGAWTQQLTNASIRQRVSRLEALQLQNQHTLEKMFGNQVDQMDALMKKQLLNNYNHAMFEMQKGFNVGWDVAGIPERQIQAIMNRPWTVDKMTFSDRIWRDKDRLVNELQAQLTQGLIANTSKRVLIRNIADKLGTSRSNAARLVRTESAAMASIADEQMYREFGVEMFEFLATLDKRTSEQCRDMDGRVIRMADFEIGVTAPPLHPYCRSTTVPWFEDDTGERAARGEDGQTYYVPSDMTYKHWHSKHVEPNTFTEHDAEVVNRYIGGEAFVLNEKLRNGIPLTPDEKDWTDRLNLALSKRPDFNGTVHRAISITNRDKLTQFADTHKIGDIVEYPAFTSFSKSTNHNPDANIQLHVRSRTGKDISSINTIEREVLYPTNSRFKVTARRVGNGGIHIFELEEE